MKNRKTSRMRCLLLALLAGAMVLHTAAALPTVADQVTLTEGEEASGAGEISAGAKPETGLTAVGENDNFLMEYDEENADVYVTDKRSGKVWSNAVSAAYYGEEAESRRNFLTNLMIVRVASESGNLTQYNITPIVDGVALPEGMMKASEIASLALPIDWVDLAAVSNELLDRFDAIFKN